MLHRSVCQRRVRWEGCIPCFNPMAMVFDVTPPVALKLWVFLRVF